MDEFVIKVNEPFESFHDIDGTPLEDGYIYIGESGLDPITNPITVYSDFALTLPITQPIRTIGGYPVNPGTLTNLFISQGYYSITVLNKRGTLIYTDLVVEYSNNSASTNFESIQAAADTNLIGIDSMTTDSFYSGLNKGGGRYYRDGTSGTPSTLYSDNSGFYDANGDGFTIIQPQGYSLNVFQFGAYADNSNDDTPYFQYAMDFCGKPFVPDAEYLFSSVGLVLPVSGGLDCQSKGGVIFNITANEGSGLVANAMFTLNTDSEIGEFTVKYPNQIATDTVGAILVYPPLFYGTGKNGWKIHDLRLENVYEFLSLAGNWGRCTVNRVQGHILRRGFNNTGHMGNVSWFTDTQFIMAPVTGFGTNVDLWCRENANAFEFNQTGGDRIDQLVLDNFSIVGGYIGLYNIGNGLNWLNCPKLSIDITSRAVVGNFSILNWSTGYISLGDSNYRLKNVPAFVCNTGSFELGKIHFSLGLVNTNSAFQLGGGSVDMTGTEFFTETANYTPLAQLTGGAVMNASGCSIHSSSGTRKVHFTDIAAVFYDNVYVDGVKGFTRGAALTLTNFNMATWGGTTPGVPDNWTTGLATPANVIRQLDGGATPGIEIFPSAAVVNNWIQYDLGTAGRDRFGYLCFVCDITLDRQGLTTDMDGILTMMVGNSTDGNWCTGHFALGDNGSPSVFSSLRSDQLTKLGYLIPMPLTPSQDIQFRIQINYLTATANQFKFRLENMQMFLCNCATSAGGGGENAIGHEFTRDETELPRDIIEGGHRIRRRVAVGGTDFLLVGERIIRYPPVVGQPKAWSCTVSGNPGTTVSEGNL